ncbi:MAG: hypothetical protein JWQ34_3193 [Mucilaginibacter sp.]|uniref:hypothetical protein n=1 Tax=Mucilaginibacter sp. TaxID=1882438 RepID=UPI00263287A8|nr:hypothetical protein [Mucilaginibacter sp.]MDB5004968.1 hypothetical protein [Mucilaginibacter sp.]
MKQTIKIIVGALLIQVCALGQAFAQKPSYITIVKNSSSTKEIVTRHLFVNSLSVADIHGMTQIEAEKRFGKLDNNTKVIILTLNPNVKLTSLGQFYKRRNISGKAKNAPLVIDGELVRDTTNLLIDESVVETVNSNADSIVVKTHGHPHQKSQKAGH